MTRMIEVWPGTKVNADALAGCGIKEYDTNEGKRWRVWIDTLGGNEEGGCYVISSIPTKEEAEAILAKLDQPPQPGPTPYEVNNCENTEDIAGHIARCGAAGHAMKEMWKPAGLLGPMLKEGPPFGIWWNMCSRCGQVLFYASTDIRPSEKPQEAF